MRLPTVTIEDGDGALRMVILGELDRSGVEEIEDASSRRADAEALVVDLRGVTFLDSGGLHYLADLEMQNRARGTRTTFVLSNLTMIRAFRTVGFMDAFDVRVESPSGSDGDPIGLG